MMFKNIETQFVLEKFESFRSIEGINIRVEPILNIHQRFSIDALLQFLKKNHIQDINGYFMNHRSNSDYAMLDAESKIQDLLFCLLIPLIPDLQYEDPSSKPIGSLTSTRKDLVSKKEKLIIETKLASSKHTARTIESEISEDINKYGRLKLYKSIIFYIYCHQYNYPSKSQFEEGLTQEVEIGGFRFKTFCIVK
ncbi:unnamed protein product, partial [marine sediment metagenome]